MSSRISVAPAFPPRQTDQPPASKQAVREMPVAAQSSPSSSPPPKTRHLNKHIPRFLSPVLPIASPSSRQTNVAPPLAIDVGGVTFPAGVQAPAQEQLNNWVAAMRGLSGEVKKRYTVGAGLRFHKPSSPRYQFVKHKMSATERTQLTEVLAQEITRRARSSENMEDLVDLYLSVQHARLRVHAPQDRRNLRKQYINDAAFFTFAGIATGGILTIAAAYKGFVEGTKARRDYYRNESRPEYPACFDHMMEMLAAPDEDVPLAVKRTIAHTFLYQFMRDEKLIAASDANRILLALNNGVRPEAARFDASEPEAVEHYRRMARTVLIAPSAEEAHLNALMQWARRGPEARHKTAATLRRERMAALRAAEIQEKRDMHSEKSFAETLLRIVDSINSIRQADNQVPIAAGILENVRKLWNQPNAAEFHYLLRRCEDDALNTQKGRKNEVYRNLEMILTAIASNDAFAAQVLRRSVGGTAHCINNAMEYISELATLSKNQTLLRRIKNGEINTQQFKDICLQNFRLETLGHYIEGVLVPKAIADQAKRRERAPSDREAVLKGTYEPELAQRIKSDLRLALNLPDSVNPSTATYPGHEITHKEYLALATEYVNQFTANENNVRAFLETDPIWREGILALAEKEGRAMDIASLESYTLNLSSYSDTDGEIRDAEGNLIKDESLLRAVRANSNLNDLYRPKTGQKVWASGVGKTDKYRTEIPAFQDLYDRIEALEQAFKVAIQNLERQYVAYANKRLLGPLSDSLPEDGKFKPEFELPINWDKEIERLMTLSNAAAFVELSQVSIEQEKKIAALENDIQNYDGQHENVKKAMTDFYAQAGAQFQLFDLKPFMVDTPDGNSLIPDALVQLRTTMMELAKIRNAFKVNRNFIQSSDDVELMNAQTLLARELDEFIASLLKIRPSIGADEFANLRRSMETFYADQENASKEYNLDKYAEQTESGESKVPDTLLKLREKIRTTVQCEQVYASALGGRLGSIGKQPSLPTGEFHIDPDACAAIEVLDKAFSGNQLEDVRDPSSELAKTRQRDNYGAFSADFDAKTGEPTDEYVTQMTAYADLARQRLASLGLQTGHASGAGNNCMIHSILDAMGIQGEANITLAAELRQDLIERLAAHDEPLQLYEYLDSFGTHPAHLIDIINTRFPDANIGMRIYMPLPNGGLHFVNPDAYGGTERVQRQNTVAIMWVGNHYEPIKVIRSS